MTISFIDITSSVYPDSDPAGNVSRVVSVPALTANGDMMIGIAFVLGGSGNTFTVPSGWNDAGVFANGPPFGNVGRAFWRVASSEPANYTFEWTLGASQLVTGAVIATYRGPTTWLSASPNPAQKGLESALPFSLALDDQANVVGAEELLVVQIATLTTQFGTTVTGTNDGPSTTRLERAFFQYRMFIMDKVHSSASSFVGNTMTLTSGSGNTAINIFMIQPTATQGVDLSKVGAWQVI